MNEEKKNVPKLRFPGFTDAWEQRKLGEVAKFRQGIQVDLENQYAEYADGRERFIRIVDYTQGTDEIRYIDEVKSANHVDLDDVVVVRYGATAGFVGHGIAGIIANNMFTINPSDSINKGFLYTFMKQEKMYESLNSSNGSSAMPAINFGIMSNIEISFPTIEEQALIREYFDDLDNLITLYQRKLSNLKDYKKAMLQKMFPKNGEKVPEIRFPGFEGDWEEHKVGDIVILHDEKTIIENEYPVLSSTMSGIYLQRDYFNQEVSTITNIGYKIVPYGYITYRSMSDTDVFRFNVQDIVNKGIVSPAYPVFSVDSSLVDNYYLTYQMNNSQAFLKQLIQSKEGGTRYALSFKKLAALDLFVPNKDEQLKISAMLRKLDSFIILNQRKLEQMKEYKKGLLQQMFV